MNEIKHIPTNPNDAFISVGGSAREVYEYFNDYLWGIGPQDHNGYILSRYMLHGDYHFDRHFRIFGELESSLINFRNGGARPVQDLNKLATTELFAEYGLKTKNGTRINFRIGEQALNYGMGTLLDIRDANVRRSFIGGKFILRFGKNRLDLFAMKLMQTKAGLFDDYVDPNQKIVGAWLTRESPVQRISRVDAYYLFTDRFPVSFAQGVGREQRHTVGLGSIFTFGNWNLYSEGDLQLGRFAQRNILAWKVVQTFTYQNKHVQFKPLISLQTAMSSGDINPADSKLNTFNPIYPKAIYYGFIDNVGSANIALIHFKAGIDISTKINVTGNFYNFWRQSIADGIYGPSGSSLLHAANIERHVGSMYDLVTGYNYSSHFTVKLTTAYYNRGPFLELNPLTHSDILYSGLNIAFRF